MDSADKRIAEERRYCVAMLTVLLGVLVALAGAATTNPVWRLPVFMALLALASMFPLGSSQKKFEAAPGCSWS